MSNKQGQSKQQRLYTEYQSKEQIKKELIELAKQEKEYEKYQEKESYCGKDY